MQALSVQKCKKDSEFPWIFKIYLLDDELTTDVLSNFGTDGNHIFMRLLLRVVETQVYFAWIVTHISWWQKTVSVLQLPLFCYSSLVLKSGGKKDADSQTK